MSGIIGSVGSKSGIIGQLDMTGGNIGSGMTWHPNQFNLQACGGLNEGSTYLTKDGINIAGDSGYGGLRIQMASADVSKYKYFSLEFDIKGHTGANHQGCFWGNADASNLSGGSSTGYKTTHQSSSLFNIRDINSNSNQEIINPGYASNDNVWHHQKVVANTDGTLKVYIDYVEKFSVASHALIPAARGYVGLIVYNGTQICNYKNIRFQVLD